MLFVLGISKVIIGRDVIGGRGFYSGFIGAIGANAPVGPVTIGGSLIGGTFGSTTQSILFNPGQVEAYADSFLPIKQDAHWEMPETVTLTLSNPTGGASLGARGSATLTIHDDGDQVKFITPLGGVPFVDWTIGNYTDRDPVPMEGENTQTHTSDYKHFTEQDAYTYDGHNGLDISLAHFAAQNAGIPVYAAADGIVIEVHDGEADRNTSWEGNPPANYVKIDHGNGLLTLYWHLRQNSVTVAAGQIVRADHVLGLVGRSGYSTGSHLHFEVRQDGTPIET